MISNPVILWGLALPMAYAVAWIVRRGAYARSSVENASTFFLFIMMASMFLGALLYVLNQTITSIIEAVVINMIVMTVGILLVLRYWVERDVEGEKVEELTNEDLERSDIITRAYVVYFIVFVASMSVFAILYIVNSTTLGTEIALASGMGIMTIGVLFILRYSMQHRFAPNESDTLTRLSKSTALRSTVIFLVLLNEFLMGWVFASASGIGGTSMKTDALTLFGNVVSSYWFIFIMVVEMTLTIVMFRKEYPSKFSIILALQAAVMLFSAPAIKNETWNTMSIYVSSGLMVVLFVYLYQFVYKRKVVERATSRYIFRLIAIYVLMLAGLFLWVVNQDPLLFSIAIVAQMILYFNAILAPAIYTISKGESYHHHQKQQQPLH